MVSMTTDARGKRCRRGGRAELAFESVGIDPKKQYTICNYGAKLPRTSMIDANRFLHFGSCIAACLAALGALSNAEDGSGGDLPATSRAAKQKEVEFERLWEKAHQLASDGKLPEAITTAKQVLAQAQELYGARRPDITAQIFNFLTRVYGRAHNLPEARKSLVQALEAAKAAYGPEDWRTSDFREALANLDRRAKLTSEQEKQFSESADGMALAEKLFGAGRVGEAIRLAERCTALRIKLLGDDDAQSAYCLCDVGAMCKSQGNRARAEACFNQAAEILKRSLGENHPAYARNLGNLALLYRDQGRSALAERTLRRSLEIKKRTVGENHLDYANGLFNLANLLYEQGRLVDAEQPCREALGIRERLVGKNSPDYAATLSLMVGLCIARGDVAKAEPLMIEALRIERQSLGAEHPKCFADMGRLAILLQQKGDLDRAERLFREAERLFREASRIGQDGQNLADLHGYNLNAFANLRRMQGDFREAEDLVRQALTIRKQLYGEKSLEYALSLCSLARIYEAKGDYGRAVPIFQQVLPIFRKTMGGNDPDYAKTLSFMACTYAKQGDYSRAEVTERQAAEITKAVLGANHPDYAGHLQSLAFFCNDQGNRVAAEALMREAAKVLETSGKTDPFYARILNSLATICLQRGKDQEAESLCRKVLEIKRTGDGENARDIATAFNNLATLCFWRHDYSRAEDWSRKSLEISKKAVGPEHPDFAGSLLNLGNLYALQGDYRRAEPLCRQALEIIERQVEATSVVQSERQQFAMLHSVRDFLDSYLSLTVQSNDYLSTAYTRMMSWKGIVLRRSRQARAASNDASLSATFRKLEEVAAQLAERVWLSPDSKDAGKAKDRIAQLKAAKEQLEADLMAKSAAYREARREPSLKDLMSALPKNAVLVDFLEYRHRNTLLSKDAAPTMERRMLAFVVSHDRPLELVSLGSVSALNADIDLWRATFGMTPQGAAAGVRLRKQLWEPIEARLAGVNTVLVSPDGGLGRLPLAALPGKRPGGYLIEEYAIATVPMPQIIPRLAEEQENKNLQNKLLLLGDVDYDARPENVASYQPPLPPDSESVRSRPCPMFPRLPATRGEIDTIAAIYKSRCASQEREIKLVGAGATKRAFLDAVARSRDVHVATHGFFASGEFKSVLAPVTAVPAGFGRTEAAFDVRGWSPGLLSGLVFAGANHVNDRKSTSPASSDELDTGILTAEEIGTLNLDNVDLVVLSACETGLGQAAGGEGLLGLLRSFQAAGARSVVASLWCVNDKATQTLMVEFYNNLWEKKLGKLEALRQAQLTMLRQYDPKGGQLRGAGTVRPVDPQKLRDAKEAGGQRLSPFYWASFVLSGDWR
jgi:CHAT domain-containing protein/tetratricopeptide (TPR) repeat protein